MFGFKTFTELFNVILFKSFNSFLVVWVSVIAFATTFIESYIYESAEAYFILVGLYLVDFVTGILKAIKLKEFCSKSVPRIAVSILGMSIMLLISYNAAKHNIMFAYLPPFLWTIFVSQNLISITENLYKLGAIDAELFGFVSKKFSFKSILTHFKIELKEEPIKQDEPVITELKEEEPKNNI